MHPCAVVRVPRPRVGAVTTRLTLICPQHHVVSPRACCCVPVGVPRHLRTPRLCVCITHDVHAPSSVLTPQCGRCSFRLQEIWCAVGRCCAWTAQHRPGACPLQVGLLLSVECGMLLSVDCGMCVRACVPRGHTRVRVYPVATHGATMLIAC